MSLLERKHVLAHFEARENKYIYLEILRVVFTDRFSEYECVSNVVVFTLQTEVILST